jgi:protein gp37
MYQILTKRTEQLTKLDKSLSWADNIWMGVTVENKEYIFRINDLRHSGANVKFLSLEPLLGPLSNLNLEAVDWVIVGGESGPGARPMKESWVIDIRDQCLKTGTAFFFKQWGGTNKKKNGRMLEGHTWDQVPETEKVLV